MPGKGRTATAAVRTAHASRYLRQLCKHFAHPAAVDFTPAHGRIVAPAGSCQLDATADRLTIALRAEDAAALGALKNVIAHDLESFAYDEALRITWTAGR